MMKSIVIGLDAFDPLVFEDLLSKNKVPHLAAFVASGSYQRLSISNPAQSEVSWTSLATGLNPGAHGLFDFVHRNPQNYQLQVSLLPTSKSMLGTQFVQPHQARTFFDQAVEDGYPATSLWWPATFPARQSSPVQTIPGLGTPDILGQLGVGSLFALHSDLEADQYKSRLGKIDAIGQHAYRGSMQGPGKQKKKGVEHARMDFEFDIVENEIQLKINKQKILFDIGQWSPIFEVNFKLGKLASITGITRAIVKLTPELQIYFLPLQIHPNKSPWPYASPSAMIRNSWNAAGPFLTLGWPQDTTALDEGIIDDEQFLALCDDVIASREKVFMHQLKNFEEGVLAIVFDTLDRVQHMFFNRDKKTLSEWYIKIDALFGRIIKALERGGHQDARVLVMSDHGFANFDHKVHVNRWLSENNWMHPEKKAQQKNLNEVNWEHTKAYALGLNSLYLNLEGREGKGQIKRADYEKTRADLRSKLLALKGPKNTAVFEEIWIREEVFEGQHSENAPDLVLGYAPGFRSSAETGIGGFGSSTVEKNMDKWNADHCINPASVQGVLMTSWKLDHLEHPSYQDIPELVLGQEFVGQASKLRDELSDEDQAIIEERMKGLGYL